MATASSPPSPKNVSPATLLPAAIAAVSEAMRICERISRESAGLDQHLKADDSPVTLADYCSQVLILRAILQVAPYPVVAEEDGEALRDRPELCSRICRWVREIHPEVMPAELPDLLDAGHPPSDFLQRYWTLDPIDGTKGYLRGGQYAVALALVENGRPILGVLGCPRYPITDESQTGALFTGGLDLPAQMRLSAAAPPRPIQVIESRDPLQARLCESVESSHTAHDRSAALISQLGIHPEPLRMDSQAKYAAVARGDAAIYMRLPVQKGYREKIWDHAAGVAVIEAAGGRVSDLNGKPLDFGRGDALEANRGVLASNGALHHAALAAVLANTPPEARWE